MNIDRARGSLIGLAVGDALGTTLEFRTLDAPDFPLLVSGPHRDILGGGPFNVVAGQVTDDTQMAACLASALSDRRGYDLVYTAAQYRGWLAAAFDVGNLTRASLNAGANFADPRRAARHAWEASDRNSAGNGSLMRTAPIGVYYADTETIRRISSLDDSAITHFDPRCRLACAAFNTAIAIGVTHPNPDPFVVREAMIHAAEYELIQAAETLKARDTGNTFEAYTDVRAWVDAARDELFEDLTAAREDNPELYSEMLHIHDHQGFVRVAFRLAFWELMHAPGFVHGVVDVVNRGGDADTNGAITGALLGACYGITEVPGEWVTRVRGALSNENTPLATMYHPNRLMDFVDAVASSSVNAR